jgi:alpha-tubulin suppressor-like RCC1 family protein
MGPATSVVRNRTATFIARRIGVRHGLALALVCASSLIAIQPASGAALGAFGWGANESGQLGNGTTTHTNVPVAVSGLKDVEAVSGGADFSVALLGNGTVAAWGEGSFGQMGNGTTSSSDVPVAVSGLSKVTAVAAGGNHALALLSNGKVMAWGYNGFGQLGNGAEGGNSDVPAAVSGLKKVVAVAAGYNYSMALLRNGTVMSWGLNESGALGNGTTEEHSYPTPAAVHDLSDVVAIAAGLGGVSTALLNNGRVMDWGYGQFGELGNGAEASSDLPVEVSNLSDAVALPDGGTSMALRSNGTVVDWGLNASGQLGSGSEALNSDVPVTVSDLSGVTAIAGGLEHRLALLSDGKMMAWGGGALGDGMEGGSRVPVEVSNLDEATAIAAGQYFSLAAAGTEVAPPPAVANVSPRRGPTAGGTEVTISGSNFTEATAVDFGSTGAAHFTVNSATSISAISPAHTAELVDVTVTTPGGTSALSQHGRYKFRR